MFYFLLKTKKMTHAIINAKTIKPAVDPKKCPTDKAVCMTNTLSFFPYKRLIGQKFVKRSAALLTR